MTRFAVIGDPIAHSRSPIMHRAAFAAAGFPHTYDAIRVPREELPRFVESVRQGQYGGINVTVPHKTSVLELVDEIHASAASVGAANTLVRHASGKVVAHNTDVPALAHELELHVGGDLGGGRALILGSGGAALAAVAALVSPRLEFYVTVRARAFVDPARLDAFRRGLCLRLDALAQRVSLEAPSRASRVDTDAALIVQATSAGMQGVGGGDDVAGMVAWERVSPEAVVYDVIYAPEETSFLARAQARGLRARSGAGMLVLQGALAQELWLGRMPSLSDMARAAFGRDLWPVRQTP